jgi:flagellar motor component MotA
MNKEKVLGLLRHTLTFVGGILISKGLVDETMLAEVVGAFVTIVGGVWSVLVKK